MRLALVFLLVALTGCPVIVALPPTKTEVAPVVAPGSDSSAGMRVSAGAHWASGERDDKSDFDVGAGYVYEHAFTGASDANDSHGGYLELQTRMAAGRMAAGGAWRSWVGLRGELLGGERTFGGVAARVSWEVTKAVNASTPFESRCVFGILGAHGRSGIGFYAETGYRRYAEDQAVTVTAGLSIRLPILAVFGLALPIPGC